jgi:hypothetical protein
MRRKVNNSVLACLGLESFFSAAAPMNTLRRAGRQMSLSASSSDSASGKGPRTSLLYTDFTFAYIQTLHLRQPLCEAWITKSQQGGRQTIDRFSLLKHFFQHAKRGCIIDRKVLKQISIIFCLLAAPETADPKERPPEQRTLCFCL